jgi:maleylacetate reductase
MEPFSFTQLPMRLHAGAGIADRAAIEVLALGATRVMLVHDASAATTADAIAAGLADALVLRWSEVAQHVPVPLAERARSAAEDAAVDGIVCVGGGSATGLAKAIALTRRVPIVAVPTTYAGSEQTTIYGLTDERHKVTGKDPVVLPRIVLYDPLTTLGLPPEVTGPSAFNALAHSVEALWATGSNPITSALALEAVRAIAESLPAVMHNPADVASRGRLQYGAALSGMALGATSAGLHHKICHVLGGMFDLVHADAHSVVLPHVVAFNAPALPDDMARLAQALGAPDGDPASALWDLARRSNVPTQLSKLSGSHGPLARGDLAAVATAVAAEVSANPRPVGASDVLDILEHAFEGSRPATPAVGAAST